MELLNGNKIHIYNENVNYENVIRNIVETTGTDDTLHICDIGEVIKRYDYFCMAMPRVTPFYAVKCNDSRIVLQTLAALGAGFDCASDVEATRVLALPGVKTSRVILANPAKAPSLIRRAASLDVSLMTVDSECELHKIAREYPNAQLVLRIRYDADISITAFGKKCGCDPDEEAPILLQLAKDLGLDVVGVSFHVGTMCGVPEAFYHAIAAARRVFDFSKTIGYNMNLLDIGGGFCGGLIDPVAESVNRALEDFFPETDPVRVIAEPGRYLVESCLILACHVHAVRDTICGSQEVSTKENPLVNYTLSDGIFGTFMMCVPMDRMDLTPKVLRPVLPTESLHWSRLWGPTCSGYDQIKSAELLPRLGVGDWLLYDNMGAYSRCLCSTFNGLPVPKLHIVATDDVQNRLMKLCDTTFRQERFVDVKINKLMFN